MVNESQSWEYWSVKFWSEQGSANNNWDQGTSKVTDALTSSLPFSPQRDSKNICWMNEKHTKPSFSPLVSWTGVPTSCVFIYSLFKTNLQKVSPETNQHGTYVVQQERCVPPLGLPRVCVCQKWWQGDSWRSRRKVTHWLASHGSGSCCGQAITAVLERNGQMSYWVLGNHQAEEHCSLWSLSEREIPASKTTKWVVTAVQFTNRVLWCTAIFNQSSACVK